MLRTSCIIFVFISSLSLFGQERKEIYGVLTDSLGKVQNAHIFNLTTRFGTFSNENGDFVLAAKAGDSLKITSIQHKTKIFLIGKYTVKSGKIVVFLQEKVYTLEEFEIKKHELVGSLSLDFKKVPTDKRDSIMRLNLDFSGVAFSKTTLEPDEIDKFVRPPITTVDPVGKGAGFGASFGGKRSRAYWALRKKLAFKEQLPDKLLAAFGATFFFRDLGIPKEQYYHFLDFCTPLGLEDLYKKGAIMDVIKLLQEQAKVYARREK